MPMSMATLRDGAHHQGPTEIEKQTTTRSLDVCSGQGIAAVVKMANRPAVEPPEEKARKGYHSRKDLE